MTGNSYSTPARLSSPLAIELSTGLTEEACTRTSTSFGAGVGAGRSSRSAGGVSNAAIATAFTYAIPKGDGNIDTAGDPNRGNEGSIWASVRNFAPGQPRLGAPRVGLVMVLLAQCP